MLGNGISTDSTKIWKHGWYKQKRGDSQLVICVFVSDLISLKAVYASFVECYSCFVALIGYGPNTSTPAKTYGRM